MEKPISTASFHRPSRISSITAAERMTCRCNACGPSPGALSRVGAAAVFVLSRVSVEVGFVQKLSCWGKKVKKDSLKRRTVFFWNWFFEDFNDFKDSWLLVFFLVT